MALVNCGECGKNISDRAPSCPHCGVPLHVGGVPLRNAPGTVEKNPAAYGLIGAVFMIAFMWLVEFLIGSILGGGTSIWWLLVGAVYGWYLGVKHANEWNARVTTERNATNLR